MKILILMGRGTEGTGQTRTAIEIHEFLESEGHEVTTLSNNEKRWGRIKSQRNKFIEYDLSKNPYLTSEEFKHVIIASTPAKNYTDKSKLNFQELINQYKDNAIISYVQVDHKIQSINRNFYTDEEYQREFFQSLDIIITHDKRNDFCVKVLANLRFDTRFVIKEMMFISCDFKSLEEYRTTNKIDKLCYFVGRKARWKGIFVLRDLQYNFLSKENFTTIAEGYELSIAYLHETFKQLKPSRIPRDDVKLLKTENPTKYLDTKSKEILLFGPYIRNEALSRLAKAKFGMFFTYLGDDYGGPVENTLMEIIAVGTIPVIRKKLWDSGKFIGARFTDFTPEEIGFIVIDEDNPQGGIAMMNLLNDKYDLYQKFVSNSTKFATKYFERSKVIGEFWRTINISKN